MSEVESLYRWGSWETSESDFAGIRVRQQRGFSITADLAEYAKKTSLKLPSHVNDRDSSKNL